MNQPNTFPAESIAALHLFESPYPHYEHAYEGRLCILSLLLPDSGLTVNEAWAILNAHVSTLKADPALAREKAAAMAAVALSLWQTGLEYKRTMEGVPCAHEGWLLLKNGGLGNLNFPDIEHWDAMTDYSFMTMLGKEASPAECRGKRAANKASGSAA